MVVVQFVKSSQSLETADSCLWCTVVVAYLTAQGGKLRAWTILSLGGTSSWVRYLWSTSIVSEMMMNFIVASTTWKER